ncbi:MAG: hypothetical protein O3B13_11335 [Planctomycetota bacterium]|nr:hypothetical protein [Planctomycetota bacterium]
MKKHMTPFILIVGLATLSLAASLAFALIVGQLEDQSPVQAVPVLAEAIMPDGTILALNAVTFGTSHSLDVLILRNHFDPFESPWRQQTVSHHTGQDRIVIWLSRRHPRDGKYLDFDWWSHCAVTDSLGQTLQDTDARRFAVSSNGNESNAGDRPFPPRISSHGGANGIQVVSSTLQKFRSASTVTLDVYNAAGDKVASLPMPNPTPQPTVEWKPETLPASRTDGELEVVLQSVRAIIHKGKQDGQEVETSRFDAVLEPRIDGVVSRQWYAHMTRFEDVFENEGNSWNTNLSFKEPAWRVEVAAFRHDNADFEPAEIMTLAPRELAKPGKFDLKTTDAANTVSTAQIRAVVGPGKTAYVLNAPARHSSSSSSNGQLQIGEKRQNRISCDVRYEQKNGRGTVSVDCELPHVLLTMESSLAHSSTTLRVIDDQGRTVRTHRRNTGSAGSFIFMETEPDARTVQFEVIVQEPKVFEFFVKPPVPEWPKK